MTKKKHRQAKVERRLRERVRELENTLCPGNEHTWQLVGITYYPPLTNKKNAVDFRCERCGKWKTCRMTSDEMRQGAPEGSGGPRKALKRGM